MKGNSAQKSPMIYFDNRSVEVESLMLIISTLPRSNAGLFIREVGVLSWKYHPVMQGEATFVCDFGRRIPEGPNEAPSGCLFSVRFIRLENKIWLVQVPKCDKNNATICP